MSEIIDYKIVCHNCKHENIFKVEGDSIRSITGEIITYRVGMVDNRICEKCGSVIE